MSRIFLSHSSKNNAEALALRDWLATQGWHDVFLDIDPERGLVAADRWRNALNAAVGRCRAVIFLLSPDWRASEHCISELDLATDRGAECIGVIIEDLPRERIPTGLGGENQTVDLTRGGTPVAFTVNPPPDRTPVTITFPGEDLRALRNGLAKLGLVGFETESFPWPPPDEPDRAPYRGLQALDVQDAGVFFGRDSDLVRAREELIDLRAKGGRKLFVIQGASGSGKSSFMRAGLLPRLQREDRDFYVLPLTRPQTSALSGTSGLASSLEGAYADLGEPKAFGELLSSLQASNDALPPLLNRLQVLAMQRLVGDGKGQVDRPPTLVLPVDQAEELFAIDANEEAAQMRTHLSAALTRGPDTLGLLTIRSDRFSLLQNDEQLKGLLQPFNLPPVSVSVYREAILGPAARSTPPISVAPQLAEALINDTASEGADPMPLLAFTMERLYTHYGKTLHSMELSHYEALNRLTGSIETAVESAFSNPGHEPAIPGTRKERERLLEGAFVPALVDINQTNGAPLSRIAPESELPEAALNIVQRLVDARLLVADKLSGGDRPASRTFRVAHEALLRHWAWLTSVLRQRATDLNRVLLIEQQAEAWHRAGRAKSWLDLRGARLTEAVKLSREDGFSRRLVGRPTEYITACRSYARRWRNRAVGALVAMVAIVITSGVIAFRSNPNFVGDTCTALLSHRPQSQHDQIAIVEITDVTLEPYVYRSPIDRQLLANLVTAISSAKPKRIAIDFLFLKSTEVDKDSALVNAIKSASSPVVVPFADQRVGLLPAQMQYQKNFIAETGAIGGYANLLAGGDRIVRYIARPTANGLKSFAEAAVGQSIPENSTLPLRIAWSLSPSDGNERFFRLPAHLLVTPDGQTPPVANVLLQRLKDRVVFIGADLPGQDQHEIPMFSWRGENDEVAGVQVHAQVAAQLLDGRSFDCRSEILSSVHSATGIRF